MIFKKEQSKPQYFLTDSDHERQLALALAEEIHRRKKDTDTLILLCIGTDKITGDCLGWLAPNSGNRDIRTRSTAHCNILCTRSICPPLSSLSIKSMLLPFYWSSTLPSGRQIKSAAFPSPAPPSDRAEESGARCRRWAIWH